MAFDESLADRIRDVLVARAGVSERKMFGGIAFMIAGNMACGVIGDDLMVRLGPDAEKALEEPHTRPMDFTGRPMKRRLRRSRGDRADEDLAQMGRRRRRFRSLAAAEIARKGANRGGCRFMPPMGRKRDTADIESPRLPRGSMG